MQRLLCSIGVLLSFALSGCASYSYDVASPGAPAPPPVQDSATYRTNDDGAGDVCAIDPASCGVPQDASSDMRPEADPNRTRFTSGEMRETVDDDQPGPVPGASSVEVSGPLAGAPAARSEGLDLGGLAGGGGTQARAAPTPVDTSNNAGDIADATGKPMLDIEARVRIDVDNTATAASKVRSMVAAAGGQIVNDVVEDSESSVGAALSVRVPSSKVAKFLADLGGVGKLRSRTIKTTDIGREYHDAEILLKNLKATLKRYEELLAKATSVRDMAVLEAAMARVRTRLERVEGDMRYMRDRAARSTVYITLAATKSDEVSPEQKLQLGVRGVFAADFQSGQDTQTFLGAGVSLFFARFFNVDLDFASKLDGGDGVNLFLATMGGEFYSDFLGGGRRRFLNPYIGPRIGYARNQGLSELALGATLGVEVFKSDAVTLDLQTRFDALLGTSERKAHPLLEPGVALYLSY